MAGEIASLRRPETGAIAAEPVPYEPIAPATADAESFQSTAGEFRKGLRSGVNSVAGSALALAGTIGERMGLTDFAASRYAEAKDFVDFSDAVAPRLRDYRAVRDDVDAANFVAGLAGAGLGSILPTAAAGALGSKFGLRGAIAGAGVGSFVPNAGEQAQRLASEGVNPSQELGNVLGVGAINAALDTAVPVAGVRRVATAARRGATPILKATGESMLGEGFTEGLQEKVGQVGLDKVAPNRDRSDDTADIINNALGGAIAGGAFGAGTAIASKGPGQLANLREAYDKYAPKKKVELPGDRPQDAADVRRALGELDRPMDPNDLSEAPDDMNKVPDWLDLRDNEVAKNLAGWAQRLKDQPWVQKFKDIATDPEERMAFYNELQGHIKEFVDKPAVQRSAQAVKDAVDKIVPPKDEKASLQRTAMDLALYDNMLKHADPEKIAALSPTQRLELAGDLKRYMLHSFGQRDPVEGPGKPTEVRGFDKPAQAQELTRKGQLTVFPEAGYTEHPLQRSQATKTVEGARETVPTQLPHALMDFFGDKLEPLMSSSHEILKGFGQPVRPVDFKKGVQAATDARTQYRTKLEGVVQDNLRDEFLAADPAERTQAVRGVTSWLTRQITEGPEDWKSFDEKVQRFFGPRAEAVLERFEKERPSITRDMEHFVEETQDSEGALTNKDVAERLAKNEQFKVSLEDDAIPTEEQAHVEDTEAYREETSPYRDKRLGQLVDENDLPAHIADLRATYPDERAVKFRAEPEVIKGEDGKDQLTGKVRVYAEDAQASHEYTEEQWEAIRDKLRKSGMDNGVITVTRKTDKTDQKPWKVSLPNLVAETMRSVGRTGGGPDFAFSMLLRGLSNLMSDPKFTGFAVKTKNALDAGGLLNIPDKAVVWNDGKKEWTFGELKDRSREGLRGEERQYWQRVVSHLNQLLREFYARRKGNPAYDDPAMEQYGDLRKAVEAGDPGAKEAYNDFVKQWAQEREEHASGYTRDETKGGGMIGIRAIEDAFDRDRRLEQIEDTIKDYEGRIKHVHAERLKPEIEALKASPNKSSDINRRIADLESPFAVQKETERLRARIRKLQAERESLQGSFSSTLKENEIEQTSRLGTEPEPRNAQEETRLPLVGPRGPKKLPPGPRGGEVTIDKTRREVEDLRNPLAGKRRPEGGGTNNFSEMRLGAKEISEADKKAVVDHVATVLGPRAKAFFQDIDGGKAGLFEKLGRAERIVVSLRSLDPRSVAFHETAHALVARLREDHPQAANTLMAAAGSPKVMAQLRQLLVKHPEALRQLSSPEERLAYMYQFWAAGKLEMGPKATSVFQSMKTWLRGLLSAWTELSADTAALPDAEEILRAFHNGRLADRSAAGAVLDKIVPKPTGEWTSRVADLGSKVLFTADGYVRGMKIPAYTGIADKFMSPPDQQGGKSGFLQVKHVERNRYMNRYVQAVKGLDEEAQARVLKELQTQTPQAKNRAERAAVGAVRGVLGDLFEYMRDKGVKVVEWDPEEKKYSERDMEALPNYFPRAYDREAILADLPAFKALLKKHGVGRPEEVAEKLVTGFKADPNESDWTAGLTYYAPNTYSRQLKIPEAALEPYLKKDLGSIMYGYVNYAVRRAEYAERFGNQGQRIAQAIEQGTAEGATVAQRNSFSQYVQAMEGSLGNEIDPKLKKFFGAVLTYQNLRLLPLALFSSLVDPAGIAVRGGTVAEAAGAFVRGIRELGWNKEDGAREFARTVGAINEATDEQMIADGYGANFAEGWQRWVNNKLFKMNGMESWNNSMRIAAASAAERFIIRQAKKPGEHSERWLSELGLTKDDVTVERGRLDLTPVVVDAINKWVDGAVLRPHAGVRPIWMSDPHFMLVSHLKQFTYSFQKAIVARSVHEAQHGNYSPLIAMTSYVPLIIAADILRAFVTPGGADNDRLNQWGLSDWISHGIARAGITGPGQYALDASRDLQHGGLGIESVMGPSVQQLLDMLRAAAGQPGADLGRELMRAVPPVPALAIRGG